MINRSLKWCLLGLTLLVASLASWYWHVVSRPLAPEANAPGSPPGAFHFTNIAAGAGVEFRYFRGETGDYWITETTGGGVALVDFDSDGWLDILVANGCQQPPDPANRAHTARLFRNQRDGTFVDVTDATGVAHAGYGQGCFTLDYDNDGFDDAYLTCWGPNALYHNNGDGTFRLPPQPTVSGAERWSSGAVPGDFDRDGDVDLFVANYLDFDYRHQPRCGDPRTGVQSYCGPNAFQATPSVMLLNTGDGAFEDVSRRSGIVLPDGTARPHAKGLGTIAADLDDDGRLDIYVANDLEPNFLFLNRSSGPEDGLRFEESAFAKGVATNIDGAAQDSMGIACGDYDGDGRLDLLVTNFYLEGVTLYQNLGNRGFLDVTRTAALLAPTRSVLGWGTGLVDFDNDGWLDLFAANGHVQSKPEPGVPYAMPAQLFRNRSGARFDDVSLQSGDYFRQTWNGRGAAFGDIDNDGDADIIVVHHHQPMAILRNDNPSQNRWIRLTLIGRRSDRQATGARIVAELTGDGVYESGARDQDSPTPNAISHGGRLLIRESNCAGSYLSANDRRVLVGLADRDMVERIGLRWPSGVVHSMSDVHANQDVTIYEP